MQFANDFMNQGYTFFSLNSQYFDAVYRRMTQLRYSSNFVRIPDLLIFFGMLPALLEEYKYVEIAMGGGLEVDLGCNVRSCITKQRQNVVSFRSTYKLDLITKVRVGPVVCQIFSKEVGTEDFGVKGNILGIFVFEFSILNYFIICPERRGKPCR